MLNIGKIKRMAGLSYGFKTECWRADEDSLYFQVSGIAFYFLWDSGVFELHSDEKDYVNAVGVDMRGFAFHFTVMNLKPVSETIARADMDFQLAENAKSWFYDLSRGDKEFGLNVLFGDRGRKRFMQVSVAR